MKTISEIYKIKKQNNEKLFPNVTLGTSITFLNNYYINATLIDKLITNTFHDYSIVNFIEDNDIQFFDDLYKAFIITNADNFQRIYDALLTEYLPLENYDKMSVITTEFTGTETDTLTKSGKEKNRISFNGTETDTLGKVGTEKQKTTFNGTENDTLTKSGTEKTTTTYDGTETDTLTKSGKETNTTTHDGTETDTLTKSGTESHSLDKSGKETTTNLTPNAYVDTVENLTAPENDATYYAQGKTITTTAQRTDKSELEFSERNDTTTDSFSNRKDENVKSFEDREDTTEIGFDNRKDENVKSFEDREDTTEIGFDNRKDENVKSFSNRYDETEFSFTDRQDSNTKSFTNRYDENENTFENRQDTNVKEFTNRKDEVTEHTHGNIGTTKNQDMLKDEINVRLNNSFYPMIFSRFIKENCII